MPRSVAKRSRKSKATRSKIAKMVSALAEARSRTEMRSGSAASSSATVAQQSPTTPQQTLAAAVCLSTETSLPLPTSRLSALSRKLSYFAADSPSSSVSSESSSLPTTIVDLNCLQGLFHNIPCVICGNCKMSFEQGKGNKSFPVHLQLKCQKYDEVINEINTSQKSSNMCDVDRKVVPTGLVVGIGHAGMQKLSEGIGMHGMHHKSYLGQPEEIFKRSADVASTLMDKAREKVFDYYRSNDPAAFSDDGILNLAVSFDGCWPKRGHTSKLGSGAVIDVVTGLAVDFHVMSLHCQVCASTGQRVKSRDESAYSDWLKQHKASGNCTQNYEGSSGGMECAAALLLWKRSESHGMRYTTLLGDGDTKTFLTLTREKPYGDQCEIKKEECVNHVSKRLNTGLRNLKSILNKKSIRTGGNAAGSLTDAKIGLLQSYHTKAVRGKNESVEAMRKAIWATFYHSTDLHDDCPQGNDSWCWYQRDLARGIASPTLGTQKQSTALNSTVAQHVKEVHDRLTAPDLLSRCLLGKTQNSNESLHSLIWMHCPKHLWAGYKKVYLACLLGIGEYNMGSLATRFFLDGVGCDVTKQG